MTKLDASALYWAPNETFAGGASGGQAASDRGYSVNHVASAFGVVGVTCASTPR